MQDALAVAFLEVVLPLGQHGVDQSGDFMSGGGDGFEIVYA